MNSIAFINTLPATPSPQECSNVYPVKAFFDSIILKNHIVLKKCSNTFTLVFTFSTSCYEGQKFIYLIDLSAQRFAGFGPTTRCLVVLSGCLSSCVQSSKHIANIAESSLLRAFEFPKFVSK